MTRGAAPKSPNNVTSTFFNTPHLLPKDIRFEQGTPNLLLAPGAISPRYAMSAVDLTTNHKPSLASHKSLMGINFR